MTSEKVEKPLLHSEWSTEDLQELYQRVQDAAEKSKRSISWEKSLREVIPWEKLAFNDHTPEECKAVMLELLDKSYVRHFRLLNELLDDLKTNAEAKTPPFIPDMPKRPMTSFFLYLRKHQNSYKDLNVASRAKLLSENFKVLSEKKKKKLEAIHEAEVECYQRELEEYCAKYPQMAKIKKQQVDEEGKTTRSLKEKTFAPPRQPSNVYTMYMQDMRAKMKEELGRDVTHKEVVEKHSKNYMTLMPAEDRERYEALYIKNREKYKAELAEFLEAHPEFASKFKDKEAKEKTDEKKAVKKKELEPTPEESDDDFAAPKSKKAKSGKGEEDNEKKRKKTESITESEPEANKKKSKKEKEKLLNGDKETVKKGGKEKAVKGEKKQQQKKKKDDTESESETSEKEPPKAKQKKPEPPKQGVKSLPKKPSPERVSSSDSEAEPPAKIVPTKKVESPKKPTVPQKVVKNLPKQPVPIPSSESESDDEPAQVKKPVAKPTESEESDEETSPPVVAKTPKKASLSQKDQSNSKQSKSPSKLQPAKQKPGSESSSGSESDTAAPVVVKTPLKPAPVQWAHSESESDTSASKKPASSKNPASAPPATTHSSSDSEDEAPPPPPKSKPLTKKKSNDAERRAEANGPQTKAVPPPTKQLKKGCVQTIKETVVQEDIKKKKKISESDSSVAEVIKPKPKKAAIESIKERVAQQDSEAEGDLESRSYEDVMKLLRKRLPGFPERKSIGALDVFMQMRPDTKSLKHARKKFGRLNDKEKEEIFAIYRREQKEYEKEVQKYVKETIGKDKTKMKTLKDFSVIVNKKVEEATKLHGAEGQSDEDSS